jgi:hypothetical protein
MKYFDIFNTTKFTGSELKQASDILKKAFPDGPKVQKMDLEKYSFNEIANHIHISYQEVSKSLYS